MYSRACEGMIIPFKRAERKKRKALTTDQIKAFLKRLQEPEFESVGHCQSLKACQYR